MCFVNILEFRLARQKKIIKKFLSVWWELKQSRLQGYKKCNGTVTCAGQIQSVCGQNGRIEAHPVCKVKDETNEQIGLGQRMRCKTEKVSYEMEDGYRNIYMYIRFSTYHHIFQLKLMDLLIGRSIHAWGGPQELPRAPGLLPLPASCL